MCEYDMLQPVATLQRQVTLRSVTNNDLFHVLDSDSASAPSVLRRLVCGTGCLLTLETLPRYTH